MNIPCAKHTDIIGHLEPGLENCLHSANRNRIVITEYSIWNGTDLQDLAHAFIPAVICVPAGRDISRLDRQSVFCQGEAIALHAFCGDSNLWTMQVSHPTASLLDEMFCGEPADRAIVGSNKRCIYPIHWPIDQHEWYFAVSN